MNPSRHRRSLLLIGALALGCDLDEAANDDGPAEWIEQPLVDIPELDAWTELAPEDDPLADHRPAQLDCPLGAWGIEHEQLEVQTGVCNYLALAQPSVVALEPGDQVIIDLWHDTLDASEPATGHVAVLLGDALLGEAEVAIPGKPEVLRFEWVAEQAVPAGRPVILHLHNHGFNAWTFVAIEARTSS